MGEFLQVVILFYINNAQSRIQFPTNTQRLIAVLTSDNLITPPALTRIIEMRKAFEVDVDYFQFKQACDPSFPIFLPSIINGFSLYSIAIDNSTGTLYFIDADNRSIRVASTAKCIAADYLIPENDVLITLEKGNVLGGLSWFNGKLFAWSDNKLYKIDSDGKILQTYDLNVSKFLNGYVIHSGDKILKKMDSDSIEDTNVIDFDILNTASLALLKERSVTLNGIGINYSLENASTIKLISDDSFVIASNDRILFYENGEFVDFGDPTNSSAEADSYFVFFPLTGWAHSHLTDILVVGHSKSADLALLGKVDGTWSILYLTCEDALAQLPFSKKSSQDDQYSCALLVDFTDASAVPNSKSDKPSLPPAPILLVLTNEGTLAPFRLVNSQVMTPFRLLNPTKADFDMSELEKAKEELKSKERIEKSSEVPKLGPSVSPPLSLPSSLPSSKQPQTDDVKPVMPHDIPVDVEYTERIEYSGYENNLSDLFCKLHSSVKADLQSNLSKLSDIENLIDTIRGELSGLKICEEDNRAVALTEQIQQLNELKGQCKSLLISLSTNTRKGNNDVAEAKLDELNNLCADAQTYLNLNPNSKLIASFYSSAIKQRSDDFSQAILNACSPVLKRPFIPKIPASWKNRQINLRKLHHPADVISSAATSLSDILSTSVSSEEIGGKDIIIEMDFTSSPVPQSSSPPLSSREALKQVPIKVSEQKVVEVFTAKPSTERKEKMETIDVLPTSIEKPKELLSPIPSARDPIISEDKKIEKLKAERVKEKLPSSPLALGSLSQPKPQPFSTFKAVSNAFEDKKTNEGEKSEGGSLSFDQLNLSSSPQIAFDPEKTEKQPFSFALSSPAGKESGSKPSFLTSFGSAGLLNGSKTFAPSSQESSTKPVFPPSSSFQQAFGTQSASLFSSSVPMEEGSNIPPQPPSTTSTFAPTFGSANAVNAPSTNFVPMSAPVSSTIGGPGIPPPAFGSTTAFGSTSMLESTYPASISSSTDTKNIFGQQQQGNLSFSSISSPAMRVATSDSIKEKKELPKSFTQFRG